MMQGRRTKPWPLISSNKVSHGCSTSRVLASKTKQSLSIEALGSLRFMGVRFSNNMLGRLFCGLPGYINVHFVCWNAASLPLATALFSRCGEYPLEVRLVQPFWTYAYLDSKAYLINVYGQYWPRDMAFLRSGGRILPWAGMPMILSL